MPLEGEYEPSPAQWVREQVELYESSGGTRGTTLWDTGLPVVIVTMRGARSGRIRKVPLMRVDLQDGPERQGMMAREITGDEKTQWWQRAVAAYPPYVEYQEKTRRVIPVFVLEPEHLAGPGEAPVPTKD
ncbi:nitroreductase/quinone reductase family protein [Streptomyces mayteni]